MRVIKWIIVLLNLVAVIIVLSNKEVIIEWINDEEKGSLFIVFILIVMLASIPGIPFGMVSGVTGAKYGLLWGSLINVTASTVAAMLVYAIFCFLLNRQGIALLERYSSLRRMEEFIQSHTFWAILIARIIPIIPAALINIYSGVFGIQFKIFLLSTLLGKIPVMIVFTYVGDSIRSGTNDWAIVFIIYVIFLIAIYGVYRLLIRK